VLRLADSPEFAHSHAELALLHSRELKYTGSQSFVFVRRVLPPDDQCPFVSGTLPPTRGVQLASFGLATPPEFRERDFVQSRGLVFRPSNVPPLSRAALPMEE